MNKNKKTHRLLLWFLIGVLVLVTLVSIYKVNSSTKNTDEQTVVTTSQTSTSETEETTSSETTSTETSSVEEKKPNPYVGQFELPIEGATGYASIPSDLKEKPEKQSKTIGKLQAGNGFKIVGEDGEWWKVEKDGKQGWLQYRYAFINLPDVLPSIIYKNTNAEQSIFQSSHVSIPEITGVQLYDTKTYNPRLSTDAYIVPVLYTMAKKIADAQQLALDNNESLVIYEGFRPYDIQEKVSKQLIELAKTNQAVKDGIDSPPWEAIWFIADGVSNHQMGYAIDVSLAKVYETEETFFGDYSLDVIANYEEYSMQTPMHELSNQSAIFTAPVPANDKDAWKQAQVRDIVTEESLRLQNYCTAAGLTPLASEWWHFNDLEAREEIKKSPSNGKFTLTEIYSQQPSSVN